MQLAPKIKRLEDLIAELPRSTGLDLSVMKLQSEQVMESIQLWIIQCRGLGPDNYVDPNSEKALKAGVSRWKMIKQENRRIGSALYNLAKQKFRSESRLDLEKKWHAVFDDPNARGKAIEAAEQEEGER